MKKLIALFCITALIACAPRHQKHNQQIHSYTQHITHDDGTAELLFWYIIFSSNNNSCYYYSSPTPVTNYSSVNWQRSDESPIADQKNIEEQPVQEVNEQELSPDMQQEIDTHAEDFGGMTQDEMGDYEGGSNDKGSGDAGGSSDGGSGDGGSSDGGGSDGGGGGDGGGGE